MQQYFDLLVAKNEVKQKKDGDQVVAGLRYISDLFDDGSTELLYPLSWLKILLICLLRGLPALIVFSVLFFVMQNSFVDTQKPDSRAPYPPTTPNVTSDVVIVTNSNLAFQENFIDIGFLYVLLVIIITLTVQKRSSSAHRIWLMLLYFAPVILIGLYLYQFPWIQDLWDNLFSQEFRVAVGLTVKYSIKDRLAYLVLLCIACVVLLCIACVVLLCIACVVLLCIAYLVLLCIACVMLLRSFCLL